MTARQTPMMRQYRRIKSEHPDAILLFHLGDFYEMFDEDARVASKVLNIALTSRDRKNKDAVPLCGIPVHAAESYIARLLRHGHRVALCDQVEDAAASSGLVRREVTRIITPGTVTDDHMLDDKKNNFLAALVSRGGQTGLAAIDLSTGEFYLLEAPDDELRLLEPRLQFFAPAEVLLSEECPAPLRALAGAAAPEAAVTPLPREGFDSSLCREALLEHFHTGTLAGFGCEERAAGAVAAGALLRYLRETQRRPLANIVRLTPLDTGDHLVLDAATQKHLELTAGLEDGRREGSLLHVVDRTTTAPGGRMLKAWLLAPLRNAAAIGERLDAVEELAGDGALRRDLRGILDGIHDLERLLGRIALNTASPRDLAALRNSLRRLPALTRLLLARESVLLARLGGLDPLEDLANELERRLVEDPPLKLADGGVFRDGVTAELDDLRRIGRDSRRWLSDYETRERERTGIPALKVGFNKVFGYYIEIGRARLDRVPADYQRRQTLVNAERFQTAALADFQSRVLGAEERIAALETRLFDELRREVAAAAARLQETAAAAAAADTLQSLAEAAVEQRYRRPRVADDQAIDIRGGRHPVVEDVAPERFVPNDCALDAGGRQIMIITGPNMAGKSTYLRQIALITLMAQAGSFVPAEEAHVGVVDRIFTRIGASDKLTRGQSTFMVEMVETAAILHHATPRSLVILDEVGRGTSTFDGLSIAWAVVEYLHGKGPRGPKTLFATHYHQLTELPLTLERAENFSIAVREWEQDILFLHRIVEGGTDKSYGIQVARLAGLPPAVIERSREILRNLEERELNLEGAPRLADRLPDHFSPPPSRQLELPASPSPAGEIMRRLREIDLDGTTPREAHLLLEELKQHIEKNSE